MEQSLVKEKASFYYAKSPNQPDHLYVFKSEELSAEELALITSLQGLTAKTKPEIYILPHGYNSYNKYLEHMHTKYGVKYTETNNVWNVVEKFCNVYKGYILYDAPTDKEDGVGEPNISINIATSLCGIHQALLIDKSLEDKAISLGIKKIYDVRDKSYEWLLAQPEYEKLAKNIMVELAPSYHFTSKLRDYAIMCNAICFYDPADPHTEVRAKILADLEPDSPVIGWGTVNKGEDKFIDPTSEAGHYYIPADHAFNITVLSSFKDEGQIKQKNHSKEKKKPERGKHYVTFVMSDGDNLQYAMRGFEDEGKLYDNELRGKVDITWGIPSSVVDLGTCALEDIYNRASDGSSPDKPGKDYFVMYCLGGYMYPSRYPSHLIDKHAEKLSQAMKKADTRILGIIDFDQYNIECLDMWDTLTKQDNIDAVFYVDYCSYHTDTDQMLWSNGKPVIASKARFWEGLPNSDIESIVNRINNAPTDPTNPNTYSLIMIHCWSKFIPDVVELANSFADHVEIVPTDVFVDMIIENVDRTKNNGIGVKAVNKTYLFAPLDIGNYQYPCSELDSKDVDIIHNFEFEYRDVANSPDGLRYGTKVNFNGPEAVFKKKFLDGLDIYIGTKLELGIYSETPEPKKIKFSFYNSKDYELFNFHKELTIEHEGWRFYSINIPFDLVKCDNFDITVLDNGGYSLVFSELVLRYKNEGATPGVLRANKDVIELANKDTFDLKFTYSNVSIEEFSLSGAFYYKPIELAVDENINVMCTSDDDNIATVKGNKIMAVSPGRTRIHCYAEKDNRKYLTYVDVLVK